MTRASNTECVGKKCDDQSGVLLTFVGLKSQADERKAGIRGRIEALSLAKVNKMRGALPGPVPGEV